MLKFLKDKLSKAVGSFSKKVDEEAEEIKTEDAVLQEQSKGGATVDVEETVTEEESGTEEENTRPDEDSAEVKASKPESKPEEEPTEEKESVSKAEHDEKPVEEKSFEEMPSKPEGVEEPDEDSGEKAAEDQGGVISEERSDKDASEEKPETKEDYEAEPQTTEVKDAQSEDTKVDDEPDKAVEEEQEEPKEKKGFFGKLKDRFTKVPQEEEKQEETVVDKPVKKIVEAKEKEEPVVSEKSELEEDKQEIDVVKPTVKKVVEEPKEEAIVNEPPPKEEPSPEPKRSSFLSKIKDSVTLKKISKEKFNDLFWDLELALLENNVALEVIEKIKADLEVKLVDQPIPRNKIEETILDTLTTSIKQLFENDTFDFMERIKTKKPYVICFIGVNGSGKTTTIAKVTNLLQKKGKSVVLAAADTFRAAAIDQLVAHANKLGAKIIKHDYGSDAAAVAFDAIKHAKSKNKDVVLIDTAGRLHSNSNLMDELKKIIRIAEPDLKIFVGESITGNDCVEQAKKFNEAVGIDAIILSKADIDEKGGASVSISYVTKKPILFIGTGQEYSDIEDFDSKKMLVALGF